MIKKVAFVYLAYESLYIVTKDSGQDMHVRPKLGLQYLCAALEKRGIKTQILDQLVESFTPESLVEKLKDFDMVGFYCSDPQEDLVKKYCAFIKQHLNVPLIVGGPCTFTNPSFLEHGCDIVVHGEGETTIQEMVDYYNGSCPIESVKGISYKKDGQIIKAPDQVLINNIDEIPFPDRSNIDINSYFDYFIFGMQKPFITMIASRGCPYRCYFCASCKTWGFKYRRRSVDNVIAEIDDAIQKYGVKYIAFLDDVFGITNDWIEEFCIKLIQNDYKIRFMIILHPFSIPKDKEKILNLLKQAGCDTLSFGLQSAHPQILKNINRNPREPESLKETIAVGNKLGFVTVVSYIIGLPGDTRETIQTTIDYSVHSGATLTNYFILTVLKGSDIEEMYKEKTICEIPHEEIVKIAQYAARKFYTNPRNLLRISYFVLIHPRWMATIALKIPSLLAWTGFYKLRDR